LALFWTVSSKIPDFFSAAFHMAYYTYMYEYFRVSHDTSQGDEVTQDLVYIVNPTTA
jgi:hypothetical protein